MPGPSNPSPSDRRLHYATAALDYIPQAIIIASAPHRLELLNRRASDLLAAGNGLLIKEDRLEASVAAETRKLHALMLEAVRTKEAASSPLLISRPKSSPLHVWISPLDLFQTRSAILIVSDPDATASPVQQVLGEAFRLTPAEVRLGGALMQGVTVSEFAASGRVSLNTARTHLKHILAKAGVSRQADFIRLAYKAVAMSRK